MVGRVRKYIEKHGLIPLGSRVLIALSGGMDSVVLLDIMKRLGYDVVAAHCNFHLRGEESDRDNDFVVDLCRSNSIPLFVKDFDTAGYASEHKVSIEVAARELRYAWFNEIAAEQGCDVIAVAHHKNDQAETVLHNIIRGTGIKGLRGMLPKNGNVIRPLLCLTREVIEQYANENGLPHVMDSTNEQDIYERNAIRHNVLPVLQGLNPDVINTLSRNADNARQQWDLLCELVDGLDIVSERNGATVISKQAIVKYSPALLHLLLEPYGFNHQNISQFYDCLHSTESKRIVSETHVAVSDGSDIIVYDNSAQGNKQIVPDFRVSYFPRNELSTLIPPNPLTAYFDADKLPTALGVRSVEPGDRFTPLGMKGSKKVHDYFIDHKISHAERENARLLCDDVSGKIVWLVPFRISADYAISDKTKRVAIITFENS